MLDENIIANLVGICSINEVNRLTIIEKIQFLQNELKENTLYSGITLLEIRYTLYKLEKILINGLDTIYYELVKFFIARWERIKNRNAQYLHDFTNPANEICIFLAQCLNEEEYLALLMPSLLNENVYYITSAYNEKDLDLKQLILTSDNSTLIHIGDVLSFAHIDGQLKRNSLFNNETKRLSYSEKLRLLNRDSSVYDYYNALMDRVNYRMNGETVGAALMRLISGLRKGGRRNGEKEHNAGNAANIAIIDFAVFFDSLSEEQKKQVKAASYLNQYANEGEENEEITLERILKSLFHEEALAEYADSQTENEEQAAFTNPMEEELEATQPIDDISLEDSEIQSPIMEEELDIIFCVELIADEIEKILKEHPELYDISPKTDFVKESLEELDKNVALYQQQYQLVIPTLTKHNAYEEMEADLSLLLEEISQCPDFKLKSSEIILIIKKLFILKFVDENHSNLTSLFFNYLVQNYAERFLNKITTGLTHAEQRFFTRKVKNDDNDDNPKYPRVRKMRDPSTVMDIETEDLHYS